MALETFNKLSPELRSTAIGRKLKESTSADIFVKATSVVGQSGSVFNVKDGQNRTFTNKTMLGQPPPKKNESDDIDFLAFCNEHILRMSEEGRESSAKTLRRVVNGLCDYFDTPKIAITEINYSFLIKYESFLSKPRRCMRNNIAVEL